MSKTDTSRKAYREILENGTDVSLRKQVCAYIAGEPSTTHELSQAFPDNSQNAVRPRVDELLRMGCIIREGKRTNPSGHEAYVHHITETGHDYLKGKIDPPVEPPLSEYQAHVVDFARKVCKDEAWLPRLVSAIEHHDNAKHRRNPEWTSEFVDETTETMEPNETTETDETSSTVETDEDTETEKTDESRSLTEEELERIDNDPVLEVSDFK